MKALRSLFHKVCIISHNAPVICNHCPPPPPTGNSGDNDFSSITALLKALHCGGLLRVITLLFIRVNSTGVYLRNITSPALTRHCGGTQKVIAHILAPPFPTHPRKWGGGAGVTNDWCIIHTYKHLVRITEASGMNLNKIRQKL